MINNQKFKLHISLRYLAFVFAAPAFSAQLGVPPTIQDPLVTELQSAALPPLKTDENGEVGRLVKSTQVWRRAKQQGIGQAQVADLVKTADENMAKLSNQQSAQHNQKDIVFSGGLLSELAATLHDDSHIIVKSTGIKVDKALQLHANNISIDFGKAKLSPTKDYLQSLPQQNYHAAIQVIDAKGVTIEGGLFDGLEAIVTARSSAVTITHIAVKGFKGYGVIVGPDSSAVAISNSDFVGGVASGIAVLQKTENVLIN